MIGVVSVLLVGFLAVASAQQESDLVEGILNDVIKPNDGLFSDIVEQFGIVSFSPTPSATTSATPSISPSASVSPAASVFASSSPLASNSALPSQMSSPTPSSSARPSSSVHPEPSPQGRRPSAPSAPLPPSPSAPSTTSSSTPSPSPDPCANTITLPASGYENLGFLFRDEEGNDTFDIDSAATIGNLEAGYSCPNSNKDEYLRRESSNDPKESIGLAIKKASDDGFLDSPKVLTLRAGWYYGTGAENIDTLKIITIASYTYNGNVDELIDGTATSVQQLSILPCCTPARASGSCPANPVATVQISKNADGSIRLSAAQIDSQAC